MSDISIRLDGLLLALCIAVGAGLFLTIALVAAGRALMTQPAGARSWKVVLRSLGIVLLHAAAFLVLAIYLDSIVSAPTGPDWIDWLAVPWAALALAGLVWLYRGRAGAAPAQARDLR